MFSHIKVGDTVTRMLAGKIPMELKVTDVTDIAIICGWWTFDRKTGVEIDDDIPVVVSFLVKNKGEESGIKTEGG